MWKSGSVALLALLCALALPAGSLAAKPRSGKFEGKVAAGYGGPQMALVVKRGKVQDVLARMFHQCGGGSQQQTIVAPPKRFSISRSGRFSGRSEETIEGVGTEVVWVKGRFTSASRVTGTIRSQSTGSGQTCDTLERRFTLTLKR